MVPYFSTLGHVCPSFSNPADFVLAKVNTDFPGHADLDVLAMEYRTRQEPEIVAEVTAVEGTPLASPDTVAAVTMQYDAGVVCCALCRRRTSLSPRDGDGDAVPSCVLTYRCRGRSRKDKEYPSSYWNQFAVLVHRNTINLIKNPGIIWIRLFMYTYVRVVCIEVTGAGPGRRRVRRCVVVRSMLSLMIGLMYLNTGDAYSTISDRISFLFYVDAFMVFMAIAVLPFCTSAAWRPPPPRCLCVISFNRASLLTSLPPRRLQSSRCALCSCESEPTAPTQWVLTCSPTRSSPFQVSLSVCLHL
jgi:hypothetical protein